jgi:hypothetical protein
VALSRVQALQTGVQPHPQLLQATSSLQRNSQLIAAARGVLLGLQKDCSQLVQELQQQQQETADSPMLQTGLTVNHDEELLGQDRLEQFATVDSSCKQVSLQAVQICTAPSNVESHIPQHPQLQ